ncbi:paraquat-inducible protein A [Rhodopila sp.]|uniref:paraquat-inducible protein A n=1 Tax=Rhodopila sp. TaxID=2480087 RepID=UPI003D0A2D27
MSSTTASVAEAVSVTSPRLQECRDCGLMQVLPAMPPASRVVCLRCDSVLRRTKYHPLLLPAMLNVSALILLAVGATLTIMSVTEGGQERSAALVSGPTILEQYGLWELSLVVLVTTLAAPLARVLCMLTVLAGLHLPRPPAELRAIFAWVGHLKPWSMVEIYLLGLFVAYVRLSGMAQVDLGPAVYALGGLMAMMVGADVTLDEQAVWEAMEPPNRRRRTRERPTPVNTIPDTARRWRIGCDTCRLVSRAAPGMHCPRCGFRLHDRKPRSIERTWAYVLAAMTLYVPANFFPVLTVVRLGAGQPSTILGGVQELVDYGMWPLAALVFFASVAVPMLKLVGLCTLLTLTQLGNTRCLHDRTVLYRIVEAIGRWSMIDIFMESILVALVQFGTLASVYPGPGALAFAAVVILTMLAARSFDPRLMWDNARTRTEAA